MTEELYGINYPGKSSAANARCNANGEFRYGFKTGAFFSHLNINALHGIIGDEWERRGRPMDDPDFAEWQRGVRTGWDQSQSNQ